MISSTSLFDISEWRDLMFNFPGTGSDRRIGTEQGAPPKSICILPFPYQEVLVQGEQKQLRLYEDRFLKLFDDSVENHCGVLAMGLIADAGIIQTVALCEIEAFNRMEGFGIFVTIRVVGRAKILEVIEQESEYIKAVCIEMADESLPPNLESPNLLASNIENSMLTLSSMEHRLDLAIKEKQIGGDESSSASQEDEDMQRRLNVAKLVRCFFRRKIYCLFCSLAFVIFR